MERSAVICDSVEKGAVIAFKLSEKGSFITGRL